MAPTAVTYPIKTAKYHMAALVIQQTGIILLAFPFFDKNSTQEQSKYSQLSVRGKQKSKFKNF